MFPRDAGLRKAAEVCIVQEWQCTACAFMCPSAAAGLHFLGREHGHRTELWASHRLRAARVCRGVAARHVLAGDPTVARDRRSWITDGWRLSVRHARIDCGGAHGECSSLACARHDSPPDGRGAAGVGFLATALEAARLRRGRREPLSPLPVLRQHAGRDRAGDAGAAIVRRIASGEPVPSRRDLINTPGRVLRGVARHAPQILRTHERASAIKWLEQGDSSW